MSSLLPFFQWMQELTISAFFLGNTWATPIIQCIHLVTVAVFVGAVLVVDMRMLGGGLTQTPLAKLARDAEPWLVWSFVILLITGLPQLTSTALKQYYSPFFWWKMEAMLFALIITFTVRRRISRMDDSVLGTFWPQIVGLVSLSLWTSVVTGARLIGLLS